MKQITLNIEESKFKAFLSFIKTLDYVSVSTEESEISLAQREEVLKRMKLMEEGKMTSRSWEEAKQDIFKR